MNLSDKDYREFHDQIWERNKELIKENRKLKQELEETEHARMLCEENWKRCEHDLKEAEDAFETTSCEYLAEIRKNEELTRKIEELRSELHDKKDALCDAIQDVNDIDKENDKLLAHIRKLEKDKDDLNKALIKANELDVVSGLNHEMDRLKEQLRRQSNTICDQKDQIAVLSRINEELVSQNHDLELANECFADESREILKDNKGLHELYMEEKEKNNNLELTNDSLTKEIKDLHGRIDEAVDILMDDESDKPRFIDLGDLPKMGAEITIDFNNIG